jgi:hypothetical protein
MDFGEHDLASDGSALYDCWRSHHSTAADRLAVEFIRT